MRWQNNPTVLDRRITKRRKLEYWYNLHMKPSSDLFVVMLAESSDLHSHYIAIDCDQRLNLIFA
jgi:hypothetical protein